MIGGDDENAKVVDDGDEKTAISSNKASRTAGGHVVGFVMMGVLV